MSYYLAPALFTLRAQLNSLYPGRDRASDGWIGDTSHAARKSDHNPDWLAGGIVRAIDIDEDRIPAKSIVAAIIKDPRVAYVIYEGRIWENPAAFPGRGYWRKYTGPSPHDHHFHVSARRGRKWDSDSRPWSLIQMVTSPRPTAPTAPSFPTAPGPLTPIAPQTWESFLMAIDESALRRIIRDEVRTVLSLGGGNLDTPGVVGSVRAAAEESHLAAERARQIRDGLIEANVIAEK